MQNSIQSLNKIDPIYRQQLQYLIIWGGFIGLGLSLFNIAVISLFLDVHTNIRVASETPGIIISHNLVYDLASAIFIAGFIGMLLSLLFIYLQIYLPFSRLVMIFLLLTGGLILVAYQYIFIRPSTEDSQVSSYIFWCLVGLLILNSYSLLILEGIFARLFNIQYIKRFTHRAGIGLILVSLVVALSARFYANGTNWFAEAKMSCIPLINIFFVVSAWAFIVAFVGLSFITFKFKFLNDVREDIKEVQAQNTFFRLWDDSYVRSLGVFLLLSVSVSVFVDYLFLAVFAYQHTDLELNMPNRFMRKEFFNFLTVFFMLLAILSLLIKTFFYKYITRKYDLRTGLLLQPATLFVFFMIAFVGALVGNVYTLDFEEHSRYFLFFFIIIIICKLIKDTFSESIEMSVFRLYLLPIPLDLRYDIQMKLEGFVRHMSMWLSGMVLLFFIQLGVSLVLHIVFILCLIGLTIYTIFILYKEYTQKLENTLSAESSKTKQNKLSLAQKIVNEIQEVHPNQIAVYLNILHILNPVIYRQAILKLLDSGSAETQETTQGFLEVARNLFQTARAINLKFGNSLWEPKMLEHIEEKKKEQIAAKTTYLLEDLTQKLSTNTYWEGGHIALQRLMLMLQEFDQYLHEEGIVIQKLLIKTNQKLYKIIIEADLNIEHRFWDNHFAEQYIFEKIPKLPSDFKINSILDKINIQLKSNRAEQSNLEVAHNLILSLKEIQNSFKSDIRALALSINEDVQSVALMQASRLCVLEAIPVLDIISKSKYFPILNNSELIKDSLHTLIAAEKRLERSRYIEQLTRSTLLDERIFGALLSIYSPDDIKNNLIARLTQDSKEIDYPVTFQALVAASSSKNAVIFNALIEKLDNPKYSHAAFAAMVNIGEDIFEALESAFYMTGQIETIQLRITQVYGRVGTERAVKLLLEKLDYRNQNVSALALNTLSECGHRIDDAQLRQTINAELLEVCHILAWNMTVANILMQKNQQETEKPLIAAIESEIKGNYDKLFSLLALLYEPQSVELVQANLYSNNPEQAEFALELLDVLLDETIKPILLPLLDISTSYAEKIRSVNNYFITENLLEMSDEDLLISLIQRDYKWINHWTKACALDELAQYDQYQDASIFLANAVNPDIILREIAFEALHRKYPQDLQENIKKLGASRNNTQINQWVNDLQNFQLDYQTVKLKFKVADFLRSIPEFEGISGMVLSEIAKEIEILDCKPTENVLLKCIQQESYASMDEIDYYIVYSGSILVYSDKFVVRRYEARGFMNNYPYINQELYHIKIIAETDTLLFKIPRHKFNEIISLHDEIPLSILNHSQKISSLMLKLNEQGILQEVNLLSLVEVSRMMQLKELKEEESLVKADLAEDLDHYVLYKGELNVYAKGREIQKYNKFMDVISQHDLTKLNLQDVNIRASVPSSVYVLSSRELNKIDELIHKVNIIKKVPEFRIINDLSLLEVAEKANLHKYRDGEQIIYVENIKDLPGLIPLSKTNLRYTKNEKQEELELEGNQFIHYLKYLDEDVKELYLEAAELDCKIYRIQKDEFDQLLAMYDQIVLDILKMHYTNTFSTIVNFIRRSYVFKNLNALELLEVAKFVIIKQYQEGDRVANLSTLDEMDFYMIYSGKVDLTLDKMVIREYMADNQGSTESGTILHYEIQSNQTINSLKISAKEDCMLYIIRRNHFNKLKQKFNLHLRPEFIPMNTNVYQRQYE